MTQYLFTEKHKLNCLRQKTKFIFFKSKRLYKLSLASGFYNKTDIMAVVFIIIISAVDHRGDESKILTG